MWEKALLLEQLDNVRDSMRSLLSSLQSDDEIYPGWGIKSILAHIAGWEDIVTRSIEDYLAGSQACLLAEKDIEKQNALMVTHSESQGLNAIRADWERARAGLLHMIARLSDEDLNVSLVFPWGPEGEIGEMIAIIANHENEHIQEILARLQND